MDSLRKRIIVKLFFISIILMAVAHRQDIRAESINTKEAVAIDVNATITDKTKGGSDDDTKYYSFVIYEDGVVQLQFQNERQGVTDRCWKVYLCSDQGEIYTEEDIYGNNKETFSAKIGLNAGEYFVKIYSYYSAYVDINYSLTVDFESSTYWEKEFNGSFNLANQIDVNKDYFGTIKSSRDEDYYKFELPSDGAITIHFSNPKQGQQYRYWSYYLYNESYNELNQEYAYGHVTDNDMCTMGLAAGTYYIKVMSIMSTTSVYTLNVEYKKSSYWEKEFNESFTSANVMEINKNYNGTLMDSIDDDYYKCSIPLRASYTVTLKTEQQNSSYSYWNVYLYDNSYNEIKEFQVNGNKTNGKIEIIMNPGIYYIRICSSIGHSNKPYKLKVCEKYSVESISVTKTELEYKKGSELNLSDIIVKAKMSDGSIKDVTKKAKINSSQVKMDTPGTYKINVSYKGKLSSITITVKKGKQKKISFSVHIKKDYKTLSIKTVKKAKVTIKANKKIFYGNKKAKLKTDKEGVAKFRVGSKFKSGLKIKITITKRGYKKLVQTIVL